MIHAENSVHDLASQRHDLDQLRKWQRSLQPERVIDAVNEHPLDDAASPQIRAVVALAQVTSGNTEAQHLLKEIAGQDPPNSDRLWMSDVGLACLLTGDVEKAYTLLHKVCSHPGGGAVDFGRLAAVYLTRGELEQARIHYQEAVDREPGHAVWHSNLGGILVREQHFEEALEQYEAALRLDADLIQAQQGRNTVLISLDRSGELVDELAAQLKNNPDSLELRLKLARVMDLDNQFTEAIRILREALLPVENITQPDKALSTAEKKETDWWKQIALRRELAQLLKQRSRHWQALRTLRQIERLGPENPVPCLVEQADAYCEMGQYEEAHKRLDEAVSFLKEYNQSDKTASPDIAAVSTETAPAATTGSFLNIELGRSHIYGESGDFEKAESILRDLLEIYPGHGGLLSQLGQTLLWTGKLDEAADLFEQASKINPMALAQMVNARRMPEDERSIKVMRQVSDNPINHRVVRVNMSFALSKIYEKQGEPDLAWHYLDLANTLVNKRLQYDPKEFSRRVDNNCMFFTDSFFAGQKQIRKGDRTSIFVVGMPRSGTTLTEQILCSHPDIFGAGELDIMSRLVHLMPRVLRSRELYPFCLETLTPHIREEAARFYLYRLKLYDTEHKYVVDKMPHNFMHLGLISLIFPKAKIIHVQRDPRDTAVSNYQQNFKAMHGGLGYAFDLEKTAMQLNDYHRMMKHWRKVLPIPMFEFRYEDLVADQAFWSRKLIEFVGLDWDESMMEFYKTERAVRTASVSQVRQPIYKTSKQKWRKYEKHLGPLLDNLNPEILKN